jgi:hypothetical protein
MKNRRKQLVVDRKVQGAILKRVFVYWLFCVLFIMTPLVLVNTLRQPELNLGEHFKSIWSQYWLSFIMAALLLPMAIMDALRLSHGFIGPIYRLRRELEQYTQRPDISFSKFREDDFWSSLMGDVVRFEERLSTDKQPNDEHECAAAS